MNSTADQMGNKVTICLDIPPATNGQGQAMVGLIREGVAFAEVTIDDFVASDAFSRLDMTSKRAIQSWM